MKHKNLNIISKRKYLLKIFVCFVILFISMLNKSGYAQNCLDSIRHNPLYSNSNNIFNGIKWIYEKKYLGSPLLVENYWPKGSIFYKGVQYSDVFMNYDLYKNQAIVFDPKNGKQRYVQISMEFFSGFTFKDSLTGEVHTYEYRELPGTKGKALYEKGPSSKISLYIKPVKAVEAISSGKNMGKFTSHFDNYIGIGNEYVAVHSKRQLITLLDKNVPDIKRYIRKNKLKINNQHPENIVAVLNYFDTIN